MIKCFLKLFLWIFLIVTPLENHHRMKTSAGLTSHYLDQLHQKIQGKLLILLVLEAMTLMMKNKIRKHRIGKIEGEGQCKVFHIVFDLHFGLYRNLNFKNGNFLREKISINLLKDFFFNL